MSDVALRFGAKDDGLEAQFRRTTKSLDDLRARATKVSDDISVGYKKIAAAAAAIGFASLVRDALAFADELEKASDKTGIAVEGLQRLQFAAVQVGVDLGTVTGAINRMQNQLSLVGEGSSAATAALARLHIPVNDFIGLKPDEQFNKVAVAISQMQSPSERTAAAIGLFGKSGAELLPVLVSAGKELNAVQARFDALGGPVSATAIARVDDIGDSFDTLKISAKNLAVELLALGSPAIVSVFESVTHFFAGLRIATVGGNNPLLALDDRIKKVQEQIQGLEQTKGLVQSILFPGDVARLRELHAELDQLNARWETLTSVGPLIKLSFDDAALSIAAAVDKIKIPTDELTSQEKRQKTVAGDSQVLIAALDESSQLQKVSQDKFDALLAQENDFVTRRLQIEGDGARFLAQVRQTFGLQEIKFEQIKNQSIIEIAGGLFGALARENSKLAKIQQGIALAQAIWSTAAGITKALELPFPASLVAAAKVALVGGIQVAKIKATNYNAGSVSSSSAPSVSAGGGSTGSAPTVSAPPTPEKERGVAQVIINGDITGEASLRWLVDRLRESIGDFDLVLTRNG